VTSPMSDYSYSQDAKDFLGTYKKKLVDNDPRLEFHQDIIKDFGESYERAYQLWNTYYAEAYRDLSYYLGNQWSLEELAYLNNQRRSSFTYNKVRRIVNLVQGYQRKNRLASVVSPVENSSEDTARIFTDCIQSVMQSCDGYEQISDAFKGALTTGLSFLSPYLDYRSDPVSGDIRFHRDDWNAVIMDPFFTKKDLSDCSFIARRKYLSRTEVISLLPNKQDVIESLPWGSRDDKFTYMPYARQWGMQKLLNYNEYWRTKWETKEVLVDMVTGETKEWDGDKARLKLYRQMYPHIEVIKKPVRSVELGIIVEGELLYYGKDPFGLNDYPFVPFMAIFEPSYDLYTWKIQSLVRIVRDPQTELNKRRSKMVDIIDNQLNSGWIAKTNSVSNPTSLYKTGQGQVIFLKPEAQMTDIQRLNAADIPASMFQLEAEFEKDIMEIAGVNSELFGMAENEKIETAGILSKMRQSAGLINLQDLFDGLRESQKLLSKKVLKLIQLNYTPEKIKLLTKKEPTPEFYTKAFAKYDISIDEGILTDTQKQSEFIQLNALRAMGVQVSDEELIEASNLHNKKEIRERIAQQSQQAAQMQQMQAEMQLKNQQVLTDAAESKAMSDRSLAHEREAKIHLDQALNAERISRAEEERTAGALNLVKALKELDGINLDNLMKKLQFLKELEGRQAAQEQTIGSETQTPQEPLTPQTPLSQETNSQPSQILG
jgi:hypothetical protein